MAALLLFSINLLRLLSLTSQPCCKIIARKWMLWKVTRKDRFKSWKYYSSYLNFRTSFLTPHAPISRAFFCLILILTQEQVSAISLKFESFILLTTKEEKLKRWLPDFCYKLSIILFWILYPVFYLKLFSYNMESVLVKVYWPSVTFKD